MRSANRPYPRTNTIELEAGGLGLQRQTRPQLAARWIVDSRGQLSCRWETVA